MIGKVTLASVLVLAAIGSAAAQQSGSSPNTGASSTQCWDAASNQVRNNSGAGSATSGATTGSGSTMNSGSGSSGGVAGGAASSSGGGAGAAATRPSGMANC
jgi:hypothetical protein